MKDEQTKVSFWAYDIFGYLLPGIILLLGLFASNAWFHEHLYPYLKSGYYTDFAILLVIAYTLGHVISGFSSLTLERLFLRHVLHYPTYQMFKDADDTSKFFKFLFPGYFRPYSSAFRIKMKQKFQRKFRVTPENEHDLFWLCWSSICANHHVAYRRATHFLELYGYSRNMSMVFLLLVPMSWLADWRDITNGYLWSFSALATSWLLFVSYAKLMRRLNDEVYRAFAVSSSTE